MSMDTDSKRLVTTTPIQFQGNYALHIHATSYIIYRITILQLELILVFSSTLFRSYFFRFRFLIVYTQEFTQFNQALFKPVYWHITLRSYYFILSP